MITVFHLQVRIPIIVGVLFYPEDRVLVNMELVEAPFILDVKIDEHAESDGDAQSESIDKRLQLSLPNVARGNLDVLPDHDGVD